MASLDVVIPVKNRVIADCVASLKQVGDCLHTILICDGESTDQDTVATLASLASAPSIQIFHHPMPTFNKATLLNYGIAQSQAEFVLLSDADIIWNREAIAALLQRLENHPQAICHIADVVETRPAHRALARRRFGYTITKAGHSYQVALQDMSSSLPKRPGCGLVCARRTTLLRLGGYKACFQGWGWEDQDLLIRACLLDIPVLAAGMVVHQSHSEALRNQFHAGLAPTVTRDRNIITCLEALQQGQLWGDLYPQPKPLPQVPEIQVQMPHHFCESANKRWNFL